MPRIREYENPIRGLDVSNAGASAIARAGELAGNTLARERIGPAIARFGDATADTYERLVVQPELNKGAALFAQYQDELTRKWNETAAKSDPNDRTIKAKFEESELEPALEKFRAGFNTGEGQKFADKQIAAFRTHMMQKTTADMSTRAAAAATKNFDTMTNSLTNMVMNDPSSFDHAIANAKANVEAITKNTPDLDVRTQAALSVQLTKQLQSEVAKAWLIGTARVNPDAAQAAIENGKLSPYINAVEAKTMLGFARQQQAAIRLDEDRMQRLKEKEEKQRSDNKTVEYLKMLRDPDPTVRARVTAQAVLNDSDMLPADRRELLRAIDREDRPQALARVSQETAAEFMRRLDLPEGDPNKWTDLRELNKAYADERLNKSDFTFLQQQLLNGRTPEGQKLSEAKTQFYTGVKPLIDKSNPLMGKTDFTGAMQFYQFQRLVEGKIEEYRRAGKDPSVLFDPSSPDYLGKRDILQKYALPLEQSLQNALQRLGPPVPTKTTPAPLATPPAPPKNQDRVTEQNPVPEAIAKKYPGAQRAPDGKIYRFNDATKKYMLIEETE